MKYSLKHRREDKLWTCEIFLEEKEIKRSPNHYVRVRQFIVVFTSVCVFRLPLAWASNTTIEVVNDVPQYQLTPIASQELVVAPPSYKHMPARLGVTRQMLTIPPRAKPNFFTQSSLKSYEPVPSSDANLMLASELVKISCSLWVGLLNSGSRAIAVLGDYLSLRLEAPIEQRRQLELEHRLVQEKKKEAEEAVRLERKAKWEEQKSYVIKTLHSWVSAIFSQYLRDQLYVIEPTPPPIAEPKIDPVAIVLKKAKENYERIKKPLQFKLWLPWIKPKPTQCSTK